MKAHPAFEFIKRQTIDSLNVELQEFRHRVTGAQHIHISADNNENVFLVALRTVPEDSRGVAHILEHTALCGSARFPVRDPFFMMIRRSLNTFMNAFTSSDWTAYPFASQNKKDFMNLLNVYLDAVFFANLDPLDFAQEGHRVEFEQPDNSESPLVYKGVVYNEMKGAMSSVPSQLWHTLCSHLFQTTTYHFNSGGDPKHIPELTYEQLKTFYQTHYHPSNAIFMTYGDMDAETLQAEFETKALSRFEKLDKIIAVNDETRFDAPRIAQASYPLPEDEPAEEKTHIVMGWLLGKSTRLDDVLEAQLLSSLLFDNSASPLQHLLETTPLGKSPSPMCGLDDSQKELTFLCGIAGSEASHADAFEQSVMQVFERLATEGLPQAQVEASLHQLELQQREVGGDGYPYGLQLILTALTAATHRGDPMTLLNLEPALARLREHIQQPGYIQGLVKKWLIDNPHRVRLTMTPDQAQAEREAKQERERLDAMQSALSDADKTRIIQQTQDLLARQAQQDDPSLLPKVGLEDVPARMHYIGRHHHYADQTPLTLYAAGTNGLVYQQAIMDMPALTAEELDLLPIYTYCVTELGVADKDYLATQQWQSEVVGSLSMYSSLRSGTDSVEGIKGYLTLSAKCLARNHPGATDLMRATLEQVRFDEVNRLRELVAQIRARREQSVTGQGHSLAMAAASSGHCAAAYLTNKMSGLERIPFIKQLDEKLKDDATAHATLQTLALLHAKVVSAPRQLLLVAEPHRLNALTQQLNEWRAQAPGTSGQEHFSWPSTSETIQQAWIANSQVNFCARAYPTVAMQHADAPALSVLAGFLRNNFLHRAIREQGGAYGGGASHDSNIASFRFYSYRDPRLSETLADFDRALEWLAEQKPDERLVEEAILGVIGSIDKPGSPAGEARQTFHAELFGRTREIREDFRRRILDVSFHDLQRVARVYLTPDRASTAVVSHAAKKDELAALGLSIHTL
ncbi:insulinase family protein [Simiduia agarivorans]|uniref:Peptidase M16 inactive domain family protein n=1 Tax=Simiduia agarivorans (strain DSM 21679 / JCM 13881 / BCRC 17597 / SA1) TaxID=1117647 RepID=K4KG89_SIMAS|nr:insulinase family protein [Simiduia agarivorans]AFU97991.1 peptidase M16 inactive domain family protein [Simiduia agarivorans SA1 = DSM 21679]